MRFTTVSIQRPAEGSTLQSGIRCQIDQLSDAQMAVTSQIYAWRSVDRYRLYTREWPLHLIQRGDTLIDELFTDEETGAAFKYRVVSRPKNHDRDHQEMLVEVVVGTD